METLTQRKRPIQRSRWLNYLVIGLALAVLGATLAWSAFDLRVRIRAQIVQRNGEILDAVTILQHENDVKIGETIASLADPGEQFDLALKISQLRDVLGVRLYSAEGKLVSAFPPYITETPMPASDLAQLRALRPVSYFSAHSPMAAQDLLAETNSPAAALLFVDVPLRTDDGKHLAGTIQFLMDGSSIARQFAALDRDLALKFSAAFVVSGAILMVGLGLALLRVQRANQKLSERTENLLQANRELALAARTSAVGAVASHLIHGLKNPLGGLRSFVHAHHGQGGKESDTDWQLALSTTQRMEELINRVVRVLQEQQTGTEYEMSITELVGMVVQNARTLAEANGVHLKTRICIDRMLSSRFADLILLVLENLVQNGIEATPPGKIVELSVTNGAGAINFEVCDQGTGLPPGTESRLFMPCTSAKKRGAGIGLAISKQLAQSLDAKLELTGNSAAGCTFRLVVPEQSP
ncbi:MAG: HAMP domain-containing sensor histidine kinase [Verrucomicrobiota bacterium]|jgi:signal transduction histidine kinase